MKLENIELNNLNLLFLNFEKTAKNNIFEALEDSVNTTLFSNDEEKIIEIFKTRPFDTIIIDIDSKFIKPFEITKILKSINPYSQIIYLSDEPKQVDLLKAFELDVDGFVKKDDIESLKAKLKYCYKKHSLRNKNIQKRETLETILNNQSGLVFLTDFKDISFASNSFLEFFNISVSNEIFKQYENVLDIFIPHEEYIHGNSKDEFIKKFKNSRAINKVVLILGSDFNPKAFHINLDKIENSELYIVSLSNISLMQRQNIETTYKAYIDSLTGIFNRNKFEEIFKYELDHFKRYNDTFCIAILDIDHFKKFNDTYGHLIGDEVLCMLADTINTNVRKTDCFARWGGEEFVLMMPNTQLPEAILMCEKLRKKVMEVKHPTAGSITSSFGVTQIKQNETLNSLFKKCDEALYDAKAAGRNKVCYKD